MYGQYARNLADFAKEQAAEIRRLEKRQDAIAKKRTKVPRSDYDRWIARLTGGLAFVWSKTFAKIGEDWVFLALLGVIMAVLSFTMDSGIYMCNSGRFFIHTFLWIIISIWHTHMLRLSSTLDVSGDYGPSRNSVFGLDYFTRLPCSLCSRLRISCSTASGWYATILSFNF